MTIERHLVGAGRLGDGLDPDCPDSVPVEQVGGNRENPLPRRNSLVVSGASRDLPAISMLPLDTGVTGQYL